MEVPEQDESRESVRDWPPPKQKVEMMLARKRKSDCMEEVNLDNLSFHFTIILLHVSSFSHTLFMHDSRQSSIRLNV